MADEINPTHEVKVASGQPEPPIAQAPSAEPVNPTQASAPAPVATIRITLDQLVNLCIEKEGSDIHFREGGRVALRIDGKLTFIENIDALNKEEATQMVHEMMSDRERERLESNREVDFSYSTPNGVNFRVNIFYHQGRLAGVMRMITKHVPTLDELGIPELVKQALAHRQGLVIVAGAVGAGKSTTIESFLNHINETEIKHILTIENPIEHIFEDKKSLFTQREVGKDTLSIERALESSVREDADVVMISEISSREALDEALNLVETGHLVITSVLAPDVPSAVEKLAGFYDSDQRKQAQYRIASDLSVVLSQELLDRQDKSGMIAVYEMMYVNPTIRNIIRQGNFVQLRTAIQAAVDEGMITYDSHARHLAEQGVISQDQALQMVQKFE